MSDKKLKPWVVVIFDKYDYSGPGDESGEGEDISTVLAITQTAQEAELLILSYYDDDDQPYAVEVLPVSLDVSLFEPGLHRLGGNQKKIKK